MDNSARYVGDTPSGNAMPVGAFSLVLHTHLPYCRRAGRWPHGEEWLHEALAETYIPLLNALYDLWEQGTPVKLTINLTPILVEQLADADVKANLETFVEREMQAAREDIARFAEAGETHLHALASFYLEFYEHIKASFVQRFGRDVVGAFRRLQDAGYVEIITCAATHGYLPLLSRDSSIYGQLKTAVSSYERHFGRPPNAIWLPECAYRPAKQDQEGEWRPGLEEFLAGLGLCCFFVETKTILGSRALATESQDLPLGPYGEAEKRYRVAMGQGSVSAGTTYAPYFVAGRDGNLTEPPVAVIGRNERTGMQVWAAAWGYPGDPAYREFHRKDDRSGLQYWRVTAPNVDLGAKGLYDPRRAADKVAQHAQHFAQLVAELLLEHHARTGEVGLISSNYDTELFGHWWFEGIDWIKQMLATLAANETVDLTTARDFLAQHPPRESMALTEGSWGAGGTHWTWDNPETHWMWEPIHRAERQMEALVAQYPQAGPDAMAALNQAARELLLLESSDWPFLVTTGQAGEYATRRFRSHIERFERLATLLRQGDVAEAQALAKELYQLDKVFPDIDYRWFAARQGIAR
jgi:1,4-alpha-glucan branching enzyme